jgi:hypothetical protein
LSALGKFAAAISDTMAMRIAAERRADGVYVAAGVELVEPENRLTTRLGEALGWQMIKRLRDATGCRVRRKPMLKACGCSTIFVGDRAALTCPDCARRAGVAQVQRLRARRKSGTVGVRT